MAFLYATIETLHLSHRNIFTTDTLLLSYLVYFPNWPTAVAFFLYLHGKFKQFIFRIVQYTVLPKPQCVKLLTDKNKHIDAIGKFFTMFAVQFLGLEFAFQLHYLHQI